jgi:glyoxylate/hydroxypyruvate reductase
VAKRLYGFGVTLLYSSRTEKEEAKSLNAKFVSMDELLEKSDFVLPLCRLTKETENLLGIEQFQKMKRDATLINVSRGGVINQNDLVVALRTGLIGSCGLDVTTPEPLPVDSPLLSAELSTKVVILPHIGSASTQTRIEMATTACDNLISALYGMDVKYSV